MQLDMRSEKAAPIGVFDSGYGGLTILQDFIKTLPEYDFIYLGDNARAPYGSRSFDVILDFTSQAVEALFNSGCHLVILACNTASAKALRTIQQTLLPRKYPDRRVLGVIRPTVEAIGKVTNSGHIGVLATPGTVNSHSYALEVKKLFPDIQVNELPCPMFVPLVENGEAEKPGADYFVEKYLSEILYADPLIDSIILGCTHYPILLPKLKHFAPPGINIFPQGKIVADSLQNYLSRHPEFDSLCSKNGKVNFLTTENTDNFNYLASIFMNYPVKSSRVSF